MKKKAVATVLTALATTLSAASTAAAEPTATANEPVVVSIVQCDLNGGVAMVPAETPISVRLFGFGQGTYGLIRDFLLKQQTTLTIVRNGTTSVVDLSGEWSVPQQLDKHFWVVRPPNYELGTLAVGETVLVTEEVTFSHPLLVAYPPVGPSGDNGPYLITAEEPATCLITAA